MYIRPYRTVNVMILFIFTVRNLTLVHKQNSTRELNVVSVIFTARCHASAVLAMALCLSVRPSVCLSVCHKSVFY